MQEQEIFQHYELKSWEFSPRIYKILGISAVLNIFLVVVLAQANFLTAKSCDTPLMSGVCSVLDTLYVGGMILDTDTGYVNEEYVKTELEDADITFINLTGQTPPLEYPSGYFAIANPETVTDPTMVVSNELGQNSNPTLGYIPGITGNTSNPTITNNPMPNLTTKPQVTPTPNKNPVIGNLPNSRQNKTNPTTTTTENQTDKDQTTAQQTDKNNANNQTQNPVNSEKVNEANINKKVLTDYANYVKAKVDKKEVDLNEPFKVVVEGVLTKDGKFDISQDKKTKKAKTQFTYWEGSEQMVDVAKKALEAVGDSGWFIYLRNFGAENFKVTLIQDGEKIFARVESDMKDENKAKTVASGLNGVLSIAKNRENLGEDEKILLNAAQAPTSNGNICIIDFAIPKAEAQAMINRNLKKLETPTSTTTENQPNSTAQTNGGNQTTGK